MRLPPIFYHHFKAQLPYESTLALQERLHGIQLASRKAGKSYPDLLLLLEHRPVYTAGRRQTEEELTHERQRLKARGADFVTTQRGGELTYHGPGQLVGYPLLDLGRSSPAMGIRDYICRMQTMLKSHLGDTHGIASSTTDLTGVFLAPDAKIASIGVQVRHRLTTHGFAMNITEEPLAYFKDVVACGLKDVHATCIASAIGPSNIGTVTDEVPSILSLFGRSYERDIAPLDVQMDTEVARTIREFESTIGR